MLDDLKYIHERDRQDALGVAQKQGQQLLHTFEVDIKVSKIDNIVFVGMGGSALAAQISTSWPGYKIPFEIVRDYNIPSYVNDNTLFIASSYSGNTEETVSALQQAQSKTKQTAVITSGGKLEEIAKQEGHCLIKLPEVLQPRMGVLYSYKALISLLTKANLIDSSSLDELTSKSNFIEQQISSLKPEIPTSSNMGKKIALDLVGKSIIVYSSGQFYPVAYKWKINFNENAKNIAWCNQLPEFDHNELPGWTAQPTNKPYAVIDIRSDLDDPRISKRFELGSKLLSGQRPEPIIVQAKGQDLLEQLLSTIALGDFVSIYLALLNGINPTPIDIIEKLKSSLNS